MRNIVVTTIILIFYLNTVQAKNGDPYQNSIAPIIEQKIDQRINEELNLRTYEVFSLQGAGVFNLKPKASVVPPRFCTDIKPVSQVAGNGDSNLDITKLRNYDKGFRHKLVRGTVYTLLGQYGTLAVALQLPRESLNWDPNNKEKYWRNFRNAYTKPPVIDEDYWWTNYIGHPYQGATYYNAYRSQGATFWQSTIMTTVHSTFWEYVIEAGFEQPSIQDLIVTPIAGAITGELIHKMTMDMRKDGFNWYEKILVTILNPLYVVNNGYSVK